MVSWVWKYFTKIDLNSAVCNICERVLARNGGTKGISGHLKSKHSIIKEPSDTEKTEKPKLLRESQKAGGERKFSWVWKHFTEIDRESAICNVCGRVLARSGGTKGLTSHLTAIHSILKESPEGTVDVAVSEDFVDTACAIQGEDVINAEETANESQESPSKSKKTPVPAGVLGTHRKSSWVWKHCTIIDKESAICNVCKKVLARSGGTKGLSGHLSAIHGLSKDSEALFESPNIENEVYLPYVKSEPIESSSCT